VDWNIRELRMSDAAPTEPQAAAEGDVPRRKGPPKWGIVVFLALLAGLVVVNQLAATGGTPVKWIDNDLAAALKQAAERKTRVFLYLYEEGDRTYARNEREVFTKRWARDPLEKVVCCRMAVRRSDIVAMKYGYDGRPLLLLLDDTGQAVKGLRTEGAVDEREFFTYIGKPIDDYVKRPQG
jgi:hypothetical protein